MEESKVKAILGVLYSLIALIVINLLQIASVDNVLSFFLSWSGGRVSRYKKQTVDDAN
jgi:hypothetical protein